MNSSSSTSQNTTVGRDWLENVVEMLRCKKHVWQREQQTGHEVCAWCNACNEPSCSHYRSEPETS